MPSRQDQLHSYQYARQRVVAALVTHDPDPHRSPLRRAGTTVLISLVVAALAVGGVAVFTLVKGTSTVDPRDPGVVFLEQGTGARFVYLEADGRLHPVLNFVSGLLVADAATPKLKEASPESLARVPLGEPLGIPDAPDSLPAAKGGLLPPQWTVCSRPAADGDAESVLSLGRPAAGGTLLPRPAPGTPAGELRGLLVSDPAGRTSLVYDDRRFVLPANRLQQIRTRFGYAQAPLAVAPAWINAVPAGPDLEPPEIEDFGEAGAAITGADVGQVLRIRGEGGTPDRWGVVLDDGVADLTAVQGALLQTEPDAFGVREVSISVYGNLPRSDTDLVGQATAAGLPPDVPVLLNGPASVCLTFDSARGGGTAVRIGPAVPDGIAVAGEPGVAGEVRADRIDVPRGKGVVVESTASATAPAGSGTVSIVTDTGRRFPLANRDLLTRLGYRGITPQVVPGQLAALLPEGPSLDPARARQTTVSAQENP